MILGTAVYLALKTEEGAIRQGIQVASRSWKRQRKILPYSLQKEDGSADILI